jgi:Ubiquitin family
VLTACRKLQFGASQSPSEVTQGNQSQASKVAREPNEITIYVKAIGGMCLTFRVQDNESILRVRLRVNGRKSRSLRDIVLIWGTKRLEDEWTLADYGIRNGSTLHWVLPYWRDRENHVRKYKLKM